MATNVDSGRMTTGSQAPGVSMHLPEGPHHFMLRQQRAAWASLQGHMLKQELMTNAQGQNQPLCVTTLLAQGNYRCGLVPVLAFSVTVRSLGPWRLNVDSGRMTMGNQAHCVSMQFPEELHCLMF